MQHIVNVIAQRGAVRFAIAAVIVTSFAIYSAPVPVRLQVAYYAGMLAPALGLALLVGWLAWSWKWFGIVLAAGVAVTVGLIVLAIQGGWQPPV
jgi:hypothetical protein